MATLRQHKERIGLTEEWHLEHDQFCLPKSISQMIIQDEMPFLYLGHWPVPRDSLLASTASSALIQSAERSIQMHFESLFLCDQDWNWKFRRESNLRLAGFFAQAISRMSSAIDMLPTERIDIAKESCRIRVKITQQFFALFIVVEDFNGTVMIAQRCPGGEYRFDFHEFTAITIQAIDDALAAFVASVAVGLAWALLNNSPFSRVIGS